MLAINKCYCPYCGEHITIMVDPSEDQQEYIEDCFVCCRPIVITASIDNGDAVVELRTENE